MAVQQRATVLFPAPMNPIKNIFFFACIASLLLHKIKQRQLVGLRQVAQKPQIAHEIHHGLGQLAAGAQIVLGQEGPAFAASYSWSAALSPRPSMVLKAGISFPSMIWK